MLEALSLAISQCFQWNVVVSVILGGLIGFTVGAIPGIGAVQGIVLVTPVTMFFSPSVALSMVMAIFMSAEFGGCVSSILVNVPGTSSAAATTLDGFPMSKKGRSITALSIGATASFCGGLLSTIICILIVPILARFILLFGTPEFFLLAVLGLVCISSTGKGQLLKGLFIGGLALLICTIGVSPLDFQQRYTFGFIGLYDGIPFLAPLLGVFGVAEMLKLAKAKGGGISESVELKGSRLEGIVLVFKNYVTMIKSTLIGLFVGLVPGVGSTTSTFIAYAEARRSSKTPDEFGKGCPEGVVATESSNNSVVAGAMMPTLLFGIPGSGTAAVILGVLMMHNIVPGRSLFTGQGMVLTLVLLVSLIICCFFCLFLGLFIAPYFSRVMMIRKEILIPSIFCLSTIGMYAADRNMISLVIMVVFGFIGFFMSLADFPVFPLVLGLVLGNMVEINCLRTYRLGKESFSILFDRPVCVALILLILLVAFNPILSKSWRSLTRRIKK